EKPINGRQLSRLKFDSIVNINKNFRLMDMQLINEKKMLLSFGINNKNMDKEFMGYIYTFDLSDDMDITAGIGWENNNSAFNDILFGNKYSEKLKNIKNKSSEDISKKIKIEDDPMDQDIKPEDILTAPSSTIILDGVKKDEDMMDYNSYLQEDQYDNNYYYTSEIILSPNGLVGATFEKAFNDTKFKIKEGDNIVDLFFCWENQEVAKRKIGSKFEIDFYSDDLEFQIGEIKNFIYNGTIPSYLESFIKKDLKELYNKYITKIFLSNNVDEAYTNLFTQSEISYIEREKISNLTSGMIYKNFVGLKLYGIGFSKENISKKFENINFEEPKMICSNLTDYQINNLSNTFFSDIIELNEININTSPNIYNDNTTYYKSKIVSILENNILQQYDNLTKTSLHRATGIRQCERCFHFSEVPHLDEFSGFSLVLPYNIITDDKKPHKKESSKSAKKLTMPSVGGENNNAGTNLYIFRGKAAWYRKYGRNCICGGRWRKW
ncbi:hypothetical protein PIROE2DRAFT_65398, partial [Piromyces sp. E2]